MKAAVKLGRKLLVLKKRKMLVHPSGDTIESTFKMITNPFKKSCFC